MTLLTDAQAAERLHVARQTLAKWRCQGKGPRYVKIGRRALYDEADLDAFIAGRKYQSTAAQSQGTD